MRPLDVCADSRVRSFGVRWLCVSCDLRGDGGSESSVGSVGVCAAIPVKAASLVATTTKDACGGVAGQYDSDLAILILRKAKAKGQG